MPKLLVIDDEPNILFSIEKVFKDRDVQFFSAQTAQEGLQLAVEHSPNVILLDIRLGKTSGLDLFNDLHRLDSKAIVIFITGHGTTDTAIEAMKLGAYDYLVKPLDADQLRQIVDRAISVGRLMSVPALIDEGDRPEDCPERLIGGGVAMRAVCKQIGRIAAQDVNVLIRGESGTGKELVARAIYHHSHRGQQPFFAVNCAAVPETLLESELFGHEAGAFPGADRRRIGKFEQCNGGTLFLDEIGDMPTGTQAKILRLLQDGRFERLGGNESFAVDVRVIAATNRDLESLIERRFRKDLFYRLRGVTIHIPPLNKRREDIAELAHYFLFRYNRQSKTAVQSIAPEALEILERYDWPGNVLQLQSVIREALAAGVGPTILPEDLPDELLREKDIDMREDIDSAPLSEVECDKLLPFIENAIANGEKDLYRRVINFVDRILIALAMRRAGGKQVRAAEILGMSRVTLRAKLRVASDSTDFSDREVHRQEQD
jgi:two-component system nitrogen regulation response regulator GlnG